MGEQSAGISIQENRDPWRLNPPEQDQELADRERATRRLGSRYTCWGAAITGVGFLAALAAYIMAEGHSSTDGPGVLFAALALVAWIMLGAVLLGVGISERLHRSGRDATYRLLQDGKVRDAKLDVLMGIVVALPDRLTEIEHRLDKVEVAIEELPDYGQGVIDGMEVRQSAHGPGDRF